MKTKITVAVFGILLLALILNAIFTWGIILDQDGGFEWSGKDYIFEDTLPKRKLGVILQSGEIRIGENQNNPVFCIPLVVSFYGIESPPYAILLDLDDETEYFAKIFIESITIKYVDGHTILHKIKWERNFQSTSLLYSIDAKNVRVPAMQLTDKLPVTIDKRQSCNVRLVGYFITKDGNKLPFDTTKFFEYEPYKWRIYPTRGSF